MSSEKDFMRGLIAGGLLGAALGLLFAPKSGERTRRDLRRKSTELFDEAQDQIAEAGRQTRRFYKKGKRQAEQFVIDTGDKIEDARTQAGRIVEDAQDAAQDLAKAAKGTIVDLKNQSQEVVDKSKKVLTK